MRWSNMQKRVTRRRRRISAWISEGDLKKLECSVFDVSEGGMKLLTPMADRIPDDFNIQFSKTSPNNGRCHVQWRKNNVMGVRVEYDR